MTLAMLKIGKEGWARPLYRILTVPEGADWDQWRHAALGKGLDELAPALKDIEPRFIGQGLFVQRVWKWAPANLKLALKQRAV